MTVNHQLTIDLVRPGVTPRLYAMQHDANTRVVAITLTAAGLPWAIPQGADFALSYRKHDGTRGFYRELEAGVSAVSVSGSTVSVTLAPQVLTCAGIVEAALICTDSEGKRIGAFPFEISVAADPAAGEESSDDYFNPTDALRYTPQTLTESQQRQARANIGVSDPVPQGYCSYGGVVLPRLPESEFPCAFIYSSGVEMLPYGVFFTQAPVTYDGRYLNLDGIVGRWHYNEYDGWCSYSEYDATGHLSSDPIIWTSHDILDESGNLYLAASQPVGREENGCKTIDLDTYGETPISLILGSLFLQGGGTMENAHLGKLMEDLLTDATLCVKFTFGVNALYLYGLNVCRVGGKCVQLAGSGVMIHQKTPYLLYLAIDNSSYADKNYGTVSLFAQPLAL